MVGKDILETIDSLNSSPFFFGNGTVIQIFSIPLRYLRIFHIIHFESYYVIKEIFLLKENDASHQSISHTCYSISIVIQYLNSMEYAKNYDLKDHSGRQTCSMTCNILTMYFNINDIYPIVWEAFDFFVKVYTIHIHVLY